MKLYFVSRLQLLFCIVFAVFAIACFVASFYNSFQIVNCCMSSTMAIVSYKVKDW